MPRSSLTLLLVLVAAPLHAQAPAIPSFGDDAGAFVALSTGNTRRLAAWYRDTLGFTVLKEGEAPNGAAKFALLQQGRQLLEILQLPKARPRAEAAPGTTSAFDVHGIAKAGFVVQDIGALYAALEARRVAFAYRLGPTPDTPYRSFGVRDQDGNLLQFFGR